MSTRTTDDLVQQFTAAMTSDDVDAVVNLFRDDPGVEWTIMATGEAFRGRAAIKQLAERSVAARNHPAEAGIKPTHVFTNVEGTQLCWEYVHTGVVTDDWPTSQEKPVPGATFELPIALVCDLRNGELVKIREYFDLRTMVEGGAKHSLYA